MENLDKVVSNLEGAVKTAYTNMASSLSGNMKMVSTMNTMMETFLESSLRLSSKVERGYNSGAPLITITLLNVAPIPIQNIALHFEFGNSKIEDDSKVKIIDSSLDDFQAITLPPSSSKEIKLEVVEQNHMRQSNFKVFACFKSPGTGRTLEAEHTCGIYLIHQAGVRIVSESMSNASSSNQQTNVAGHNSSSTSSAATTFGSSNTPGGDEVVMRSDVMVNGATFRDVFKVNPLDGLRSKYFELNLNIELTERKHPDFESDHSHHIVAPGGVSASTTGSTTESLKYIIRMDSDSSRRGSCTSNMWNEMITLTILPSFGLNDNFPQNNSTITKNILTRADLGADLIDTYAKLISNELKALCPV